MYIKITITYIKLKTINNSVNSIIVRSFKASPRLKTNCGKTWSTLISSIGIITYLSSKKKMYTGYASFYSLVKNSCKSRQQNPDYFHEIPVSILFFSTGCSFLT